MKATILEGDVLDQLAELRTESVQCVVTSPPYWGLRDYGVTGQIGLERTPEEYVEKMVAVFREVRRVLRRDGTLWLNMGDSYANSGGPGWQGKNGQRADRRFTAVRDTVPKREIGRRPPVGLKPKDLVGIPWRLAFALQADGWWLRCDVIWSKPNPMPESVTDRPTKAHEYVFLLTKAQQYFYDAEAVKEPVAYGDHPRNGAPGPPVQAPGQVAQSGITKRRREGTRDRTPSGWEVGPGHHHRMAGRYRAGNSQRSFEGRLDHKAGGIPWEDKDGSRNLRSVWTITTQPFPDAHFSTFPEKLAERCVKAGTRRGDAILDPFAGSGTAGVVALSLQRNFIGIELNPGIRGDGPPTHRRGRVTPG